MPGISLDRFGPSTLTFANCSMEQAIEKVRQAGFGTMELFPRMNMSGFGGYFRDPGPVFWPTELNAQDRARYRRLLEGFKNVILHVNPDDVNIASINPGLRAESQRQYVELLELGVELGAKRVTVHYGNCSAWACRRGLDEYTFNFNVQFGKRLADLAEKHDLLVGYENGHLPKLRNLIDAVGHPRFGLLLDIPHAVMKTQQKHSDFILDDIRSFAGRIVELHAHGLYCEAGTVRDHNDWDRNNSIHWPSVVAALKAAKFDGPVVFEISARDLDTTLRKCLEYRQNLVGLWNAEKPS